MRYISECSLKQLILRHDVSHGWEDNSTYLNNQKLWSFQYKLQILNFFCCFFLALQTHYIAIGEWHTEAGQTMQTPVFAAASILLGSGLLSSPRNKAVIITHSMRNNMLAYYIVHCSIYALTHWKLLDFIELLAAKPIIMNDDFSPKIQCWFY